MLSEASPLAVVPGAVRLQHGHGGAPFEVACDAVVLVTQRLSNEALYLELAGDPGALAASGHRCRLPHGRLRRPALARRHGLRRAPPGARDRRRRSVGLPADPARARRPGLASASGRPRERAAPLNQAAMIAPARPPVPGGTDASEAGANPALSRNCDAPSRGRARSPDPHRRFESSQEGLIVATITAPVEHRRPHRPLAAAPERAARAIAIGLACALAGLLIGPVKLPVTGVLKELAHHLPFVSIGHGLDPPTRSSSSSCGSRASCSG